MCMSVYVVSFIWIVFLPMSSLTVFGILVICWCWGCLSGVETTPKAFISPS